MEIETEANTETEMEVKTLENKLSPSAKRFGIKNTIQTNSGDDYVFQIASSQDASALAVSLPSNAIKLYSPLTGQYFGECLGHCGTIHEVSFPILSSSNLICSCSSDATVKAWDMRTFNQYLGLERYKQTSQFEDARSLPSDKWNLDDIGGTGSGTLGYFSVDFNSPAAIGPPDAILEGGHTGVVRTALPFSNLNGSLAQNNDILGWTGGEDGCLCCWLSDDSFQANRSWITSALSRNLHEVAVKIGTIHIEAKYCIL